MIKKCFLLAASTAAILIGCFFVSYASRDKKEAGAPPLLYKPIHYSNKVRTWTGLTMNNLEASVYIGTIKEGLSRWFLDVSLDLGVEFEKTQWFEFKISLGLLTDDMQFPRKTFTVKDFLGYKSYKRDFPLKYSFLLPPPLRGKPFKIVVKLEGESKSYLDPLTKGFPSYKIVSRGIFVSGQ